ncbi:MAG: HPF/RaiA family ribosome-associated protein [Burkholderiales bacterium]
MQIGIQARGFKLTDGLRDHCARRLRFALGSATGKVHGVMIRLADQNGPRGGIDKRCTIRATLHDAPLVTIVQDEADLYVAIDRAVDRLARAISRRLERTWSIRRAAMPMPSMDDGVDTRPG